MKWRFFFSNLFFHLNWIYENKWIKVKIGCGTHEKTSFPHIFPFHRKAKREYFMCNNPRVKPPNSESASKDASDKSILLQIVYYYSLKLISLPWVIYPVNTLSKIWMHFNVSFRFIFVNSSVWICQQFCIEIFLTLFFFPRHQIIDRFHSVTRS